MQVSISTPMTIKWNLAYLMLDQNIKTGDLAAATGLHANTISKLKAYREMPKRLDSETLNKLCQALKCQPGDLLRYTPDEDNTRGAIEQQKQTSQKSLEPQQRSRKPPRSKAILKVIPKRRTA